MGNVQNKMPKGISYIIGNEAAERFSYYGMKAILTIFMTEYLLGSDGQLDPMDENESKIWYHLFGMSVYAFPLIGAILSDAIWGKYKTIIILSIVYCFGHLALAMDETRLGLSLGLTMIAIGSGGIKPCVSAHVGDQFDSSNQSLIERVFSYFYFAINLGAAFSSLLTPWLLQHYGPSLAFGIPGGLMLLATIVFWWGRDTYRSIPPSGSGFIKDFVKEGGWKIMLNLCLLYLFISVFWSLFDQTGSSWVIQAKSILVIKELSFLGYSFTLLPSQIQAANPIMVMALIPVFTFVIYPLVGKVVEVTPLRKISVGMFIAALSFAIIAWMQAQIDTGNEVSIFWQFLAYLVITIAEVMVSITCLEFSYKQAPNSMKSFIMAFYLLSVSLGNLIAALVNTLIRNEDGSTIWTGSDYFMFFTYLMLGTAIGFIVIAKLYKERTFIQGE